MVTPPPPQGSRQQRRLAAREKAKRLADLRRAAPLPDQAGLAGQAEVLADLLGGAGPRRAGDAADAAHRGYERSVARHFKGGGGPGRELACAAGCAHCCHAYISVSAPEALLAARAVRALPRDRREAALARVRATDESTRGRAPDDRKGAGALPCPLLDPADGRCTIYADRPLSCRAELSADADACERLVAGAAAARPVPVLPFKLKIMYGGALALAARQVGLQAGVLEYNAALRVALDTPDAEARWLAGEDVFAAAAVHPEARAQIDRALGGPPPRSGP
ncbi:MAG: YkgJ family cysteine cluster protein [Hyphomicrobiales bacterium]|nr:YkgJ family cysteine cluster protein [Hyphomicrobiales bacterium]MCP5373178.1 YkgJ family cysteine cluster protein [Hyphomicrobiales bacterium]